MSGIAVLAVLVSALPGAVVLQPVANMYSRPTSDSDVASQAIYGANVDVLEQKDGWAHIRTADNYTGWTPLSALSNGPSYANVGHVAEVQCLFAHLINATAHQTPTVRIDDLSVPYWAHLLVAIRRVK